MMSRKAQIFAMSSSMEFEKRTSLGTRKAPNKEPFLYQSSAEAASFSDPPFNDQSAAEAARRCCGIAISYGKCGGTTLSFPWYAGLP